MLKWPFFRKKQSSHPEVMHEEYLIVRGYQPVSLRMPLSTLTEVFHTNATTRELAQYCVENPKEIAKLCGICADEAAYSVEIRNREGNQ